MTFENVIKVIMSILCFEMKLKEGHCILFFVTVISSRSHNDIGNVYLLFLSKATGKILLKALRL